MTSIMAPWPFYQWGMDILGPLPQSARKVKFVVVAIDYFTKWIEAKPLARITRKEVKKFVWDNIVCRFRFPRIIVTNNGTQFVNDPFRSWYERLNIQQMNTAIAHPQANGMVERANKSLMEVIKSRLGRDRAGWVDELPNVLWAHRTSLKTSNVETPFSLTYESEAVIPAEIGMPIHRTMMVREDKNEDELHLNMDLLQERREGRGSGQVGTEVGKTIQGDERSEACHNVIIMAQVSKFPRIGRCNNCVVLQNIPCSLECKIVGQILLDHLLSYALTTTADILIEYLQQIWNTVSKVPDTNDIIRFKLNSQEIVYTKKDVIQYPRFTKLIIVDLMKKYSSIPQRLEEDYHSIKDDIPLVSVYSTGNVTVRGMLIPNEFITDDIRATEE
ncbi:reverse transcriptase domain-containing protein [Tanacetum coccineum]